VADDVVRLPDQLVAFEAAHGHEGRVAIGDPALQVGGGHQRNPLGDHELLLGDGQVVAHVESIGIARRNRSENPGFTPLNARWLDADQTTRSPPTHRTASMLSTV
jgi:hypothetical protein